MLVELVKQAAQEIFAPRKEVVAAYLYGSILRTADFNDIDIGILLDNSFKRSVLYEEEIAEEFEKRVCHPVDIRILNGRPIRFLFQVVRDSVLVFSTDEKSRIDFEKRVMLEYYDLRYYYQLYDQMRRERYVQ